MRPSTFNDGVAAIAFLVSLALVGYAALIQGRAEALGALITVVSAGGAWFLRAKYVPPGGNGPPTTGLPSGHA